MVCEAAGPGAWSKAFCEPNRSKFDEPTVEEVDYPSLAVRRAWNDVGEGVLHVGTCVGTPSRAGAATTFRITQLPDPKGVSIRCDGTAFPRWRVVADDAIEIETDVATHEFRIDVRAAASIDVSEGPASRSTAPVESGVEAESRGYRPEAAASCSCCQRVT